MGGLINATVWLSPASVIVIVSGIDSVDLNFVSDNLNEFLSRPDDWRAKNAWYNFS